MKEIDFYYLRYLLSLCFRGMFCFVSGMIFVNNLLNMMVSLSNIVVIVFIIGVFGFVFIMMW